MSGPRTGSALLYDRFSKDTLRVLVNAHGEAEYFGRWDVGCEQLFLALLKERRGLYASILTSAGITFEEARRVVGDMYASANEKKVETASQVIYNNDAERTLELAWDEAQKHSVDQIEPKHILLALLNTDSPDLAYLWSQLRVNRAKFKEHVAKLIS